MNSNKKLHQSIEVIKGNVGQSGVLVIWHLTGSLHAGLKEFKLQFLVSARQMLTASSSSDQLFLPQATKKCLNIRQYFEFESETEDCSFQGVGQKITLKFYLNITTHLIFIHNSHSFSVLLNNGCN
jgi:hypothetical protein